MDEMCHVKGFACSDKRTENGNKILQLYAF